MPQNKEGLFDTLNHFRDTPLYGNRERLREKERLLNFWEFSRTPVVQGKIMVATGKKYVEVPLLATEALTIGSGTVTVDLDNARDFDVTWDANITTITVNNWMDSGYLCKFMMRFAMDGTARTVSWPAGWDWPSGTAPTAPSINEDLVIEVWSRDGGTTISAVEIGRAFA